jgi:DNA polymerase
MQGKVMDVDVKMLAGGLRELAKLKLRWNGNWLPFPAGSQGTTACASRAGFPARTTSAGGVTQRGAASAAMGRTRDEGEPQPRGLTVRRLTVADQFKGSKGEVLKKLAAKVAVCKRCPLYKDRTKTVFGVGEVDDGGLMLIGEAPGHEEDVQGEPFVGAAGRLLDRLLVKAQIARANVYIGNVLKCRPPNNRLPQPLEVVMCLPFLRRQIEIIKPAVFCALGRHAVHALTGKDDAIGKLRGTLQKFEGVPVVPTYHPAYLLRNAARTDEVIHDLAQAWEMVEKKQFA